jgi:hypothetical protein
LSRGLKKVEVRLESLKTYFDASIDQNVCKNKEGKYFMGSKSYVYKAQNQH